ncbi:MAG: hypothetical protein JWO58_2335 [Chitinophagaceae bacterium]|nr:hypothetical protein [Chitinophagaceae bacterium]
MMSNYKDNLNTMFCLDIYISSLSEKEYDKISHKIKTSYPFHPLLSADIPLSSVHQQVLHATKKKEWNTLQDFAKTSDWTSDLASILANDYVALEVLL